MKNFFSLSHLEKEYGSIRDLSKKILSGDIRTLSRCITLSESSREDHQFFSRSVLEKVLPMTGKSLRIGISGPPGVGKSTFIETFGTFLVDKGKKIAVLAVDPSSSKSGGSILGDKTRMERLSQSDSAFIRPSPAGETLGGVSRHTREALLLCEASGYDTIIVETVGVGQSEATVSNMIDIFILLISPGGGDELQGIKRGIVELADLIIVNKADGLLRSEAENIAREYNSAVKLLRPKINKWNTRVVTCSALENKGIEEIWSITEEFFKKFDQESDLSAHRKEQFQKWLREEITQNLNKQIYSDKKINDLITIYEKKVLIGEVLPSAAAYEIVKNFLKK
tara:strand:- start:27977 stop:28993 length:1017 start_codon:yes stop_codon:yes gene_type:complete